MTKKLLRRFRNTKIKIWQYIFYWWEPCWQKKIQFEEEKFKIKCLWIQLNFIEGLIEFMKGLTAIKIDF